MKSCLSRGDGKEYSLYTHNGTKAIIRHLRKDHKQQISMGGQCSSSSSTPHVMGRGPGRPVKARGPPQGQGGRRTSSSRNISHVRGCGPGQPVKTRGPPHGQGGAALVEPTPHGARPGPAPSYLQRMGHGPARLITLSKLTGPAHHIFKILGSAQTIGLWQALDKTSAKTIAISPVRGMWGDNASAETRKAGTKTTSAPCLSMSSQLYPDRPWFPSGEVSAGRKRTKHGMRHKPPRPGPKTDKTCPMPQINVPIT